MGPLAELQDRQAGVRAEMRGILDKAKEEKRDDLSEDEEKQFNELEAKSKQIAKGIEREEKVLAVECSLTPVPACRREPPEAVEARKPITTATVKDPEKFKTFGEQLLAVRAAAIPGGRVDPRLGAVEALAGVNEGVASEGGFLVQTDFSSELLQRAYETGAILSRVRRLPISANANGIKINAIDETSRVTGSRFGGIQVYWIGEGAAKTLSEPKLRQIELSLKKLAGLLRATDELLQDSIALPSLITQAFSEELEIETEDSMVNGTGAAQPLGILNSACLVTVSAEVGQAAATIVYENICNMWSRMWARSRMNAIWLINQDIEPQLFTMGLQIGAAGGSPVYTPPGGASAAPYGMLFGRPVIPVEYCQTLGTVGDIILSDWSQYITIDKGGVQAATSIHVRFIYDQSTFRFVYRVDGQPSWNSDLTPMNGTNTVSPFVVLETRS